MDVSENLFQAIDILIKKKIEAVRFDETVNATIIDASKSSLGQYLVSTGNAKFYAYSQETKYRKNDVVLVTIPQGDYNNQKVIIGKKVDKTNTALTYLSPFSQIIDISNNLIIDNSRFPIGIWANDERADSSSYKWDISESEFTFNDQNTSTSDKNPIWNRTFTPGLQGYTRLGIQAQFRTFLEELGTISGNYGLLLRLTFEYTNANESDTSTTEENQVTSWTKDIVFDSSSFFGNPYDYITYYTVEDVFDIKDFANYPITKMELFLYQRNNFIDSLGERIEGLQDPPSNENTEQNNTSGLSVSLSPNIWIKDPYICVGTDLAGFQKDTAEIYCSSIDMTYNRLGIGETNETAMEDLDVRNTKIIQLRWLHKDEDTGIIKVLSFDDDIDTSKYEIRWYRYQAGLPSPDQYAGAHWERINYIQIASDILENDNSSYAYYKRHFPIGAQREDKQKYIYDEMPTPRNWLNYNNGKYTLINNRYQIAHFGEPGFGGTTLPIDSQGCIAIYQDERNTLQLIFYPDTSLSEEFIKAIIINKNTQALLAESNILTFTNQAEIPNQATLININALAIKCTDEFQGHYYLYNAANKIENQKLAQEFRTLQAIFGLESNIADKSDLNIENCKSIKWIIPTENTMIHLKEGQETTDVTSIEYYIDDTYTPEYQDNTVQLEIETYQGETYRAELSLVFGTRGDNGSDYTIDFRWSDNKNALNVSVTDDTLTGNVALRGKNGEQISWPGGSELQVSWHTAIECGTTATNMLVKKSADIGTFYPVVNGENGITQITFSAANPDAIHQPDNWYHLGSTETPVAGTHNYIYNNETRAWSFTNATATNYLYKQIDESDNKKQLTFKPIESFANIDYTTGSVTGNASDAIEINDNKKTAYNYFPKTWFIKNEDQYVIDPIDGFREGQVYYEPYEALGQISQQSGINLPSISSVTATTSVVKSFTLTNASVNINTILILELRVTHFGDYDLIKYVPVPLTQDVEWEFNENNIHFIVKGISGSTQIVYNSDGTIGYYRNPFEIRCTDLNTGELFEHGINSATLRGYWKLIYPKVTNDNDNFLPTLIETRNTKISYDTTTYDEEQYDLPILNPIGTYIPEAVPYAIQFVSFGYYTFSPDITHTYSSCALWTQPIVCYQNKYQSGTINTWDGKGIKTDNDTGTIVASGFAAGRKEVDNTFSGVMLGDWSRTHQEHAVIAKNTGIYGFNHGAMSYAFKDDGTGFIGKDGRGRIHFDGNNANIYSSEWLGKDQRGMFIDLDDGYLKMQSTDESQYVYTRLYGDVEEQYFNKPSYTGKIYYKEGNSTTWTPVTTATTYNPATIYYFKEPSTRYITMGSNQPTTPLSIGTEQNVSQRRFRVDWDGTVHVINGDFTGNISGSSISGGYISGSIVTASKLEANNGQIGGWTIKTNYLSSGGTTLHSTTGIITNTINIYNKINDNSRIEGSIGSIIGNNNTYILGIKSNINSIALEAQTGGQTETDHTIRLTAGHIYIEGSSDLSANIVLKSTNNIEIHGNMVFQGDKTLSIAPTNLLLGTEQFSTIITSANSAISSVSAIAASAATAAYNAAANANTAIAALWDAVHALQSNEPQPNP